MEMALTFGMSTIALIALVLMYIRRMKGKMRKSVLRFERIQDKVED